MTEQKTMEIDGVKYVERPATELGECGGCAFAGRADDCEEVAIIASIDIGRTCGRRNVIYTVAP